ncbi:MAG: FmdE family protein [Planctomycetaceae bacterium]|jgi:formylmethanofuran dehydrogenase subunit E|nr:FmdE family protein [Planctomycetaceae bacterium]
MLTQNQIDGVIAFHGHHCPGLTFGMRIGDWVLNEFGHATDEEIVAVVETDNCSVDAIQYLVGCTFGKGNLVFLDYGKNAYSFFRRSDDKSCRLIMRGGLLQDLREQQEKLNANDIAGRKQIHQQMIDRILQADFEKIFSISHAQIPMPETARIHPSQRCDCCGELVMATRLLNDPVLTGGKNLCIPCRNIHHKEI